MARHASDITFSDREYTIGQTGGQTIPNRSTHLVPPHPRGYGTDPRGTSTVHPSPNGSPTIPPDSPETTPTQTPRDYLLSSPNLGDDGQFLEWTDQAALYQCACVADFRLGMDVWYAGLPFLGMEEGDIVE